MKIVLAFPPFYLEPMYNLPPLGLINLATALKAPSREILIHDFVLAIRQKRLKMDNGIYDHCAEMILDEAPDLVAFSAQCTTYPGVLQVCRGIKAGSPNIRTVIGGHNASFVDRITLERFPFVDAIVRGEGEITFKELVAAYESGKDEEGIDGVTCRRGKEIIRNRERDMISELDQLPLPDYSFSPPLVKYRDACGLPRSIAILEVGRGCPHRCIYCSESLLWRRRTRTFSVSRLVKEMRNLHENFGAECFLLAYDQFTAERSFVESFCHQVIEAGLNHLPWYCISRLDSVDADLLSLMRDAGCESMCYGIDSGSERTLAFIRKNIDKKILYQRVVETAEQGIIPTLSFVIGFPEEKKEDIDETLRMALRTGIVGNNNPLIQLPTILPGTDLHMRYVGHLVRKVDTYFSLGLEFDNGGRLQSDEEMINSEPTIFSSFYNLPCPACSLEELNLIASYFPLIVRLYPKTFLVLSVEFNSSISDFFIQWLHWLKGRLKKEELTLSPQECYLHFREFVKEVTVEKGHICRKHFYDILKYENLALQVGTFTGEKSLFSIDMNQIMEFRPAKSKRIIIEEFDFDIPVIIFDLMGGDFRESYPPQKKVLVFKHFGDILEVSEINLFTRDLLELCSGKERLVTISKELQNRYGRDMGREEFFNSCIEAVQVLGEEGLLEPE